MTRTQLETLLIDILADNLARKPLKYDEKARLRSLKEGVSRGAFNRTLKQARQNIIKSIYTVILLGYFGIFENTQLDPYLEVARKLQTYIESYRDIVKGRKPTQEHLTAPSPFGALSLYLQVLSSQNYIIDKQTIQVTLPEGAKYLQVTPTPLNTSALLTPSISYAPQKVTPFTIFSLSLQYEFNIFWAAFRPTLWLGVVILGFAAIIYIRKQKQIPTIAIPDPNISVVQTLVEACGERTGLWNQIETLENDFDNRRIRRKDFNRRRRILIQRLGTITNEITTLNKRVSALGTQFREHITRLTQAETEYQATRTEITRLRTQLRRGRLSSNAYKQEKSDRDKTLQRMKATIDDIVYDLNKLIS